MIKGYVNSLSQKKHGMAGRVVLMTIMLALLLAGVFFMNVSDVNAEDYPETAATPGDAENSKDGLVYEAEQGKWYLYTNGEIVTEAGWAYADAATRVFVSTAEGAVTKKLTTNGNIKRLYLAQGGNWIPAKSCVHELYNKKLYLFDGNGIMVTKAGWYTAGANATYYVSGAGCVTHRLYKSGSIYTYSHYDYTKKAWVSEKDCWKTFLGKSYYFAQSGVCTRLYNVKTRCLYIFSNNRFVPAKNNIYKLSDNKIYFFNSKGIKTVKSGWKKINSKNYAFVNKNGYVTLKYVQSKNTKKLYQYNYNTKKWAAKKNSWQTIAGNTYKFNKNGVAVLSYNSKTKKCYDYKNKKWVAVKKQVRNIQGKKYFFNKKGRRVTKAGTYKTSDGYIAGVNKKGLVYSLEMNLEYSRYYTIKLANGKTAKVYGHYDLDAADKIIAEVNRYRSERHESSLRTKASLTKAANTRAAEISRVYSHTRPNGTLCISSIPMLYGENIAAGFSSYEDCIWAWKRSQGHNENMLRSDYKYIGVSVFVAEKGDKEGYKYYYVQAFGK